MCIHAAFVCSQPRNDINRSLSIWVHISSAGDDDGRECTITTFFVYSFSLSDHDDVFLVNEEHTEVSCRKKTFCATCASLHLRLEPSAKMRMSRFCGRTTSCRCVRSSFMTRDRTRGTITYNWAAGPLLVRAVGINDACGGDTAS